MKSTGSNCDRDALIGLLDESLAEGPSLRVRDHLRTCDACRIQLESLESTLALARNARQPVEMNPFEARAFVHKVRGRIAAKRQASWKRLLSPALGGGFVSGAVVGALVLFVALGPLPQPGTRVPQADTANDFSILGWGTEANTVENVTEDEQWAGLINAYLLDTASEQELFSEMETLIGEDELYALLEEY